MDKVKEMIHRSPSTLRRDSQKRKKKNSDSERDISHRKDYLFQTVV